MKRTFKEGLVFGLGFGVSFILVVVVTGVFIPRFFVSTVEIDPVVESSHEVSKADSATVESILKDDLFHQMTIEDQIQEATAIAVADYEPGDDGRLRVIIREFLKRDQEAKIYYDVGDEVTDLSRYTDDRKLYGDGVVIYFVGSPARVKMSMTYSGDRIASLGDIPMKLFREKCEESLVGRVKGSGK